MTTNLAPLYSHQRDDWATPHALFASLDREFRFALDAAAAPDNTKCVCWIGPEHDTPDQRDALQGEWRRQTLPGSSHLLRVWLNPPYSQIPEMLRTAWLESTRGRTTVVCLVPSRTDTRWFHELVWDHERHRPQPYVSLRFLKGRVRFDGGKHSAPFPSMLVIFWCETDPLMPEEARR